MSSKTLAKITLRNGFWTPIRTREKFIKALMEFATVRKQLEATLSPADWLQMAAAASSGDGIPEKFSTTLSEQESPLASASLAADSSD